MLAWGDTTRSLYVRVSSAKRADPTMRWLGCHLSDLSPASLSSRGLT